jgi:hypothetical protein
MAALQNSHLPVTIFSAVFASARGLVPRRPCGQVNVLGDLNTPITLIFQASYYGRGNPTYWVANNEVSETGKEATNMVILWSGTSVCL